MEKYESMLKFKGYIVNEVFYKLNKQFKPSNEGTSIDIDIIPQIETCDNDIKITLNTNIFNDSIEKNYPFEMKIELVGEFTVEGDVPEKFITNAIAILYPYIRAIVSTYTASANVSPLILPAINVNKLIEDQQKETK